jgi:hypothetical protein
VRKLNEIGIQKAGSVLCFGIKSGNEGGNTNEKTFTDCNLVHFIGIERVLVALP